MEQPQVQPRTANYGDISMRFANPHLVLQRKIRMYAHKHNLDPNLFLAQIETESTFNPNAISSAGAHGLGQVMPVVADWCGHTHESMFDEDINLDCSARYMVYLLDYYNGNMTYALAAYNFGAGNVNESLASSGTIPNPGYVGVIEDRAEKYKAPIMPYLTIPRETRQGAGAYHSWPMGRDYSAGCGATMVAPIDGIVTGAYYNRNWIGPHGEGKSGDSKHNSWLIIRGTGSDAAYTFTILHSLIKVEQGDRVVKGVTVIAEEANEGNSTGCHAHITVERGGVAIDYFGMYGIR